MDLKTYVPALARFVERRGDVRVADHGYLEKDVLLHLLLRHVAEDPRVRGRLVFKGGTCLVKCYLNYPRFSVDLDFTWLEQDAWSTRPTKDVRDLSRPARHAARDAILDAAKEFGLRVAEPNWGHNSEKLTIEARYDGIDPRNQLVKFQVNFCDPLIHRPLELQARSLLDGARPPELILLDEALTEAYAPKVPCLGFDPREIVAEKGRAILTRRVPKGRDILDLFLIERDLGVSLERHVEDVRQKTRFSVTREGKYDEQLDARDNRLAALARMDIQALLLRQIDNAAFEAYRARILATLTRLGDEISAEVKAGRG